MAASATGRMSTTASTSGWMASATASRRMPATTAVASVAASAGVRRAVATIASTVAPVARHPTVATVAAGRTRLHDGLPHVELRAGIIAAALVAARTRLARVAGTRRCAVPVAAALTARSRSTVVRVPARSFGTVGRRSKRFPFAPIRLAPAGRREF